MVGVAMQIYYHTVATNLQAELDTKSNKLTFNKINSPLLFQHITKKIQ